ncbi:leucine-rich repeat domain-containing protein [Thiolapillus brandeum]|nr:leucine-rich repeat domain-containing protein [Thiolapillus brandeum]
MLKGLEKQAYAGAAFNMVLALYVLVAHDWVFKHTYQAMFYASSYWPLGVLVLLVQLLDFLFLPGRLAQARRNIGTARPAWDKHRYATIMVVLGHFLISFLLMVVGFRAFGFHQDLAVALAGSLTVLKEMVLWLRVGYRMDQLKPLAGKTLLMADAGLLVYSALAYTLTWEPFAASGSIMPDWGHWTLFAMSLGIVVLVTTLFLLPLRIPWLVEEWSGRKAPGARVVLLLSFVWLIGVAVTPYFKGEVTMAAAMERKETVEQLFLEKQSLSRLPEALWEMQALRVLDLGQNQIDSISPQISRLVNLEILRLDHNPLKSLPKEIGQLPRLRQLDLRGTGVHPGTMRGMNLENVEVKW